MNKTRIISIIERFQTTNDNDELDDESILNVFRREDEFVLKTQEIADKLPITSDWTSKRLKRLENEGRVHSKSAGGRVWWLNEDEPDFPVSEGVNDILWYASISREVSKTILLNSGGMFIISGMLLIPIILMDLYQIPVPFTTTNVATVAMLMAILAALLLVVGGSCRLISIGIHRHYAL